jgi:predicted TIM-barrel fold metal-dependent hydrolase
MDIISVDDHVVEPPDLWTTRLPAKYAPLGPRSERLKVEISDVGAAGGNARFELSDNGEWADVWHFEDVRIINTLTAACAGVEKRDIGAGPVIWEDMRPGCFRPADRLSDMDINSVEASLCFPNIFVRFCGQRFLEAKDKELGLLCVRAYNDFIVDEGCGGSGGRLVPLCIVPLWDIDLAVAELRRNAARGVRAVSFPELPVYLDLPSIHSGHWDPLFRACVETDTVLHLHLGSGSKTFGTSADAPNAVGTLLTFVTPAMALSDWLLSGLFIRFPKLIVALAESNIGWVPNVLERADTRWSEDRAFQPVWKLFDRFPSTYFASNMFCSFFSDQTGVSHIAKVGPANNFGIDNIVFETDYPHQDGTWPNSRSIAERQLAGLSAVDQEKILRGNARRLLRLDDAA